MSQVLTSTRSCKDLLEEYRKNCLINGRPKASPLIFDLTGCEWVKMITAPLEQKKNNRQIISEITLYNPTKLIEADGKNHLALRVEPQSSEEDSHVLFFEEVQGKWRVMKNSPHLHLQDPFYIGKVQGYHILGGVEIYNTGKKINKIGYRTLFYRYKHSIAEIKKPFAQGPDRMKDIRLIELPNGKIGVFTRPQGGKYGLGKIGYVEIDTLEELTPENILRGKVIERLFTETEWGGANDLYILDNKKIGVLGHIAFYQRGKIKNYYAMTFVFDPILHVAEGLKIIAGAEDVDFMTRRKNEKVGNVIFSGGLKFLQNGQAKLYAGINDIKAVCFELENPFLENFY